MRFSRLLPVSAVALVAVGVLLDADVDAYATNGYRWASTAIQYYVNPQSTQLGPTELVNAVRAAAEVWNTQSAANIDLTYAGTTSGSALTLNYKNEVFFRNEASANGYTAATYWWYSGGVLVDADIVYYENHRWYTSGTECSNGFYVENTGAHEFGHALGLGHSDSGEATMWGSTGACMTSKQTLDVDDIAGVEALYPPTTTAPSPTEEPAPAPAPAPSPKVRGGRGKGKR